MVSSLIFPIILPIDKRDLEFNIKNKRAYLSYLARKAATISCNFSNHYLKKLSKDKNGVPISLNNIYWSISHKSNYVTGVVSPEIIGIDIEQIVSLPKIFFEKTASTKEWKLNKSISKKLFFRYWTAKEAVLKAEGCGVLNMLKCKIKKIINEAFLLVEYEKTKWLVEHFFFDKYIIAVTRNSLNVQWCFNPRSKN